MKYLAIIVSVMLLVSCGTNTEEFSDMDDSLPVSESSVPHEHAPDHQESDHEADTANTQRRLVMNGYNVELKEGERSLGFVTTKGNVTFSEDPDCRMTGEISYKILQATGEYGVVLRRHHTCQGG